MGPELLASGFGAWSELSGALRQLQALEPDRQTARLQSDAEALFRLGIKTLAQSKGRSLSVALRYDQPLAARVSPTVVAAERQRVDATGARAGLHR